MLMNTDFHIHSDSTLIMLIGNNSYWYLTLYFPLSKICICSYYLIFIVLFCCVLYVIVCIFIIVYVTLYFMYPWKIVFKRWILIWIYTIKNHSNKRLPHLWSNSRWGCSNTPGGNRSSSLDAEHRIQWFTQPHWTTTQNKTKNHYLPNKIM
jgi:hypothetical protein